MAGSRAGGFHSRTIEILDQRGIADRFLAEGQTAQTARFGRTMLDISDVPTRHPYGLALWQSRMEPILAGWVDELGVPVHRGREVTGFVQDDTGVDVELADGETMRATYLVGADGGRSVIRKVAGIDFPGWDATRSNLIAEVEVAQEPPSGMRQDETGVHGFTLLEDGRTYRVITTEQQVGPAVEPSLADLSDALTAVYGTDFGVHDPTWLSRFTDATRQAATYRKGRVPLVGDAAHIHYPAGGQGIGLGLQDAVNLGWKPRPHAARQHDETPPGPSADRNDEARRCHRQHRPGRTDRHRGALFSVGRRPIGRPTTYLGRDRKILAIQCCYLPVLMLTMYR